jgi:hypothetical protein
LEDIRCVPATVVITRCLAACAAAAFGLAY